MITAQDIFEKLELDELRILPAAQAPMKDDAPGASGTHRLAMIQQAIGGFAAFTTDDRELQAGGINYTIDTVNAILEESPDAEILWVIGADHLATLADWKEIDALVTKVQFICAARATEKITEEHLPTGIHLTRVQTHTIEISSSEIRKRLHNGLPVDFFLPHPVYQYITKHSLYQ